MSKRFGRRGLLGLFAGMAAAAKVAPVEAPPVVAPTPAVPPPPPVVAKTGLGVGRYACSATIRLPASDEEFLAWRKQAREQAIATFNRATPRPLTEDERLDKEGEDACYSGAYDYYDPDDYQEAE